MSAPAAVPLLTNVLYETKGPIAYVTVNRPEVLLITAASQMLGSRRTALHPLGSLDDHAYAMNDASMICRRRSVLPMYLNARKSYPVSTA